MTMTIPQRVAPGQTAALAAATRVRWNYIAPTLLAYWIMSMFDKSNISIVIANPTFLNEMQLGGQTKELGWLVGSLFISYGIAAPVWGWAVTRYGPRNATIASLIVWALTCFWAGMAQNFGMLLASRIGLGAGEAACYPITLALVANWFALRERGKATAYWWIGTMIGPMLVGLIVTSLILTIGWRGQFFALGVLALIVPLPMVWFLVRDYPQQNPAVNSAELDLIRSGAIENNDDAPGRILKGVTSVWGNYRFWLMTIAISSNAIFFWGWSGWLPTYLRTERHFTFSMSGYLTFVIYGFAVVTILVVGRVSDRLFRRAPLAGLGWASAAVFLMAASLAPSPTWAVVLMICALCAQQVGISCAEMLMHSVVGTADMGKSQGVRAFVTQMFGAFSPVMIGYILALTGGAFIVPFAFLAAAVVISATCMIALAREGL
ncbi:MAG TPA: MFS transporter [Xanthobacteraceae bacterium]|nr:MFS transporter [Xanthobacteraceae bacterium]